MDKIKKTINKAKNWIKQNPKEAALLAVVLICMGLVLVSIFRRKFRWPLYGIAGWVVAVIIAGAIAGHVDIAG